MNHEWRDADDGLVPFGEVGMRLRGTLATNQGMMERFPIYPRVSSDLEAETRLRMVEPTAFSEWEEVVKPVVIQVVSPDLLRAISDAQIQSQIDAMNGDFSATNPDL